jgi:hypothetical protein
MPVADYDIEHGVCGMRRRDSQNEQQEKDFH